MDQDFKNQLAAIDSSLQVRAQQVDQLKMKKIAENQKMVKKLTEAGLKDVMMSDDENDPNQQASPLDPSQMPPNQLDLMQQMPTGDQSAQNLSDRSNAEFDLSKYTAAELKAFFK